MIHFYGPSATVIFKNIAKQLMTHGNPVIRRGLKTMEIEDAWITLEKVNHPVCFLRSRGLDFHYLRGEMDFYNSGSLEVKDIEKFSKFWSNLANSNGTINSNYGFLAEKEVWAGMSQFEFCEKILKEDLYSRQAIINYNQPRHKYIGNKDFVCTISQQFIVRNEKLDSIVLMRSNDLIYGLTYDMPYFCSLQEQMAHNLGIQTGKYLHYAASLHVYERHFRMVEAMARERISPQDELTWM